MEIMVPFYFSFYKTDHSEVEQRPDKQAHGFGKIHEVKDVDDVTRIHQEDFENATGNDNQHEAVKDIGLALAIFFRKEKEGKKYCLDDAQENKNGKEVDAIRHFGNLEF